MYYVGTLFISKFPYAFEEQRIVNGVEQTCLVIPCEAGQMERTRYGAWFCRLRCEICPPNPQQRVLSIKLGYKNLEELVKAKKIGLYDTTKNMGYLFVAGGEESKDRVIDKTNNMTQLYCEGRLFIDSIAREDIKTDHRTGRKYVDFTFRKSRLLDAFGNSHEVVVKTDYGEHQIGVARQIDIEPSPENPDYATKRDERTVEQRCVAAGDKNATTPQNESKCGEISKEDKKPSVYDSFEW